MWPMLLASAAQAVMSKNSGGAGGHVASSGSSHPIGALAGLAGGGGLSSSDSAKNGDYKSTGASIGGMTINAAPKAEVVMTKTIVFGLVIVVAVLIWIKK